MSPGPAALLAMIAAPAGGSSDRASAAQSSELRYRPASAYAGFGLVPALPRPSFSMRDTGGAVCDFGFRTAGGPTVLFFGYTHCPDDCPTTMADIHGAVTALPAEVRARTLVAFVTTDPKRDHGRVVVRWLPSFDTGLPKRNFIGLTGTRSQFNAARPAAYVAVAQDDDRTHSTSVLLYGPDDYAHVPFTIGTTSGPRSSMIFLWWRSSLRERGWSRAEHRSRDEFGANYPGGLVWR